MDRLGGGEIEDRKKKPEASGLSLQDLLASLLRSEVRRNIYSNKHTSLAHVRTEKHAGIHSFLSSCSRALDSHHLRVSRVSWSFPFFPFLFTSHIFEALSWKGACARRSDPRADAGLLSFLRCYWLVRFFSLSFRCSAVTLSFWPLFSFFFFIFTRQSKKKPVVPFFSFLELKRFCTFVCSSLPEVRSVLTRSFLSLYACFRFILLSVLIFRFLLFRCGYAKWGERDAYNSSGYFSLRQGTRGKRGNKTRA